MPGLGPAFGRPETPCRASTPSPTSRKQDVHRQDEFTTAGLRPSGCPAMTNLGRGPMKKKVRKDEKRLTEAEDAEVIIGITRRSWLGLRTILVAVAFIDLFCNLHALRAQ